MTSWFRPTETKEVLLHVRRCYQTLGVCFATHTERCVVRRTVVAVWRDILTRYSPAQRNIAKKFSLVDAAIVTKWFKTASRALTVGEFDAAMDRLRDEHPAGYAYITTPPRSPDTWACSKFRQRCWGKLTSNDSGTPTSCAAWC